jgi:hypothetical protein
MVLVKFIGNILLFLPNLVLCLLWFVSMIILFVVVVPLVSVISVFGAPDTQPLRMNVNSVWY